MSSDHDSTENAPVGASPALSFGSLPDDRAEYVHPHHAAYVISAALEAQGKSALDSDPAVSVLRTGGVDALRAAYAAVGAPTPEYFDEATWMPVAALSAVVPDFRPTRVEVAQWCADHRVEVDPHDAHAQAAAEYEAAREGERSRYASAAPVSGNRLSKVMYDNADVFDSSAQLRHIATFAHARGAGAWATLGGVLMRVMLGVPHTVVLPPIIGGEMSLNQMVVFAGVSSGGKDSAQAAANGAVRYMVNGEPRTWTTIQPGTGEGLNRSFAKGVKVDGRPMVAFHTRAVLFGFRDVAAFESLAQRQGTTLIPELLKAAHGQELGFANADTDRRVLIPPHYYRLSLSMGVQPGNGNALLNDQAVRDGLPQRLLWLPIRDGRRRGVRPDAPDPLVLHVSQFGVPPMDLLDPDNSDLITVDPNNPPPLDMVWLEVAEPICRLIQETNDEKDLDPFGRTGDPLAGHRLLTREKVAAALAVLHGETDLSMENWERAGALMAVSEACATESAELLEEAAAQSERKQGQRLGERYAAADESKAAATARVEADKAAARVHAILRKASGKWLSQGVIRQSMSTGQAKHLDAALDALVSRGQVERSEPIETRPGQFTTKFRARG